MVVFDHAPTALLASRLVPEPVRRVVIGSGFCVPPDECPLPAMPVEPPGNEQTMRQREAAVLLRANHVLEHSGKPTLTRLGELYSDVDETLLTTFAELEQYPSRVGAEYWGPVLPEGGAAPRWPAGEGKRVFAYLKRFDGLPAVLGALRRAGH